jgi:putative Holliday junction resolvase
VILGIDPGSRRVGIAMADPETRFARPLEVIDTLNEQAIERVVHLIKEHGVTKVVVGRPVSLSGSAGPAVEEYAGFVEELRRELGPETVPVVEYDERLTSVVANRSLEDAGMPGRARRKIVDAVAAQVMLQGYLDRMKDDAWR